MRTQKLAAVHFPIKGVTFFLFTTEFQNGLAMTLNKCYAPTSKQTAPLNRKYNAKTQFYFSDIDGMNLFCYINPGFYICNSDKITEEKNL